jgi:hypothetical protein
LSIAPLNLNKQSPIPISKTATTVTVTLARPQRSPIANETAANGWVDLGGMRWKVIGHGPCAYQPL